MNKEKFISFMQNPDSLNKESMDELSYLLNEFPYCQSAHILQTLNHFKENSMLFESSLKSTAIYVANRKVLKKHIDRLSSDSSRIIFHDEGLAEVGKSKEKEKQDTPKEKIKEEHTIESKPNNTVKEEKTIEQKDTPITTDSKHVEIRKEKIEENTPPIDKDKKRTIEFKPKSKKKKEEPIPEMEKEQLDINKSRSISELKKIVEKRIREIEAEKKANNGNSLKPKETKTKKSDLIDTFIKNQPVITRQKASFYDAREVAAYSIVDQENIVSETLAKIYLDQGHPEKAINIYEKLNLKYPEKSIYFAALIEKAKAEDNNKK